MFKINENYLKLPGSYLFSTIAKKVSAYSAANPDKEIIRLGIGDVTLPLAPVVIDSLHNAVDEMGKAETFHGYAPDLGYEFLRNAIVEHDYKKRGADISADEIFVSDGAKSDSGNIGDIFSVDNKIAVCDPVYPVYVDTNAMAGRTGDYIPEQQKWSNVIYMPCTAETNFAPELPKETPDIIYLCFPNNPTGSTITKDELQRWVDYANKVGAVIIYDAAYEAYISEENVPHTIYECEGARTCAIELRSFSKNAGFTGTRLGFTVIPKDLKSGDVMLHSLWARRHGTKFNGAPYIIQRAGENIGAIGCGDIFHRKERREGAAFTTIILIGSKPYRFTFLQCTDNAAQIISADHRFVRAHAPTGLHPFHQLIIMWTIGSHHWLAQSHHAAAQFQRHKMDADNHYAAILHLCAFKVIQPFNIKPFTYATVGPEPCHAGFYQRHAE